MQVVPSGGLICNELKSRHLVAIFAINDTLLPNLIQFTESISGSVVPLAMFWFDILLKTLPRSVGSGGSRRSREDQNSLGSRPSEFLQVVFQSKNV